MREAEDKKGVFMLLSIQCLTQKPIFLITQYRKTGYPGAKDLTEVSRIKPHGAAEGENLTEYSKQPLLLSFLHTMVGARRGNRELCMLSFRCSGSQLKKKKKKN